MKIVIVKAIGGSFDDVIGNVFSEFKSPDEKKPLGELLRKAPMENKGSLGRVPGSQLGAAFIYRAVF